MTNNQVNDSELDKTLKKYLSEEKYQEYLKMKIPIIEEPRCKELRIQTDIDSHDYKFTGYFISEKIGNSFMVRTYYDSEHKEIDRKYIINMDFIVSIDYKY